MNERATMDLRFLDGKLQQRWEIDERQECGDWQCAQGWHTVTRSEWRYVKAVAAATLEEDADERL